MRRNQLKFLGFCLLLCGIVDIKAIPTIRKVYAEPKMTQQIRYIQSLRKPFRVVTSNQELVLPSSVDHSKSIFFPPIINQDGGSCAQASGIGYMFTYEMNRLLGRDASISAANRFSYLFSWNMLNGGEDQGGFVDEGLFLAERYGMMTEDDYGTSSVYSFRWASGYEKYLHALHYRTSEIITMTDSIPLMKRYLYDCGNGSQPGGVLTFSTQSSNWKIDDNYQGPSATGYHSILLKLATLGSHALTIAGYDDLVSYTDDSGHKHTGAFIVVNSWGSYSHDNGRFYLPYDFFRDPSISTTQLSNEVIGVKVTTFTPQIVFKVNLNYSSRNDLSFAVGGSDKTSAKEPTEFYYSTAFRNQGGDYPMQGHWSDGNFEFALDFSTHPLSNGNNFRRYFLEVIRSSRGNNLGEGSLDGVQVIDYRTTPPRIYSYRDALPSQIQLGENVYTIPVDPRYVISASPYRYLNVSGTASNKLFLLHTASGNHAKMQVSSYDKSSGCVSLHYTVLNH
jgi:hypothetical protein